MYKNRLGVSFIEVMIALGVMSIAALASASLLHTSQRGLRALNGGTQYLAEVARLQLFFTSVSPSACANALITAGGGPPRFLPQPSGSPTPSPSLLPRTELRRIQMDGIVLADVYASGGASRFSSIFIEEQFPGLRTRTALDPNNPSIMNASTYVGQIAFEGQRNGDIIGGRNLPEFTIPVSFTVRDPLPNEVTGPVVACQMGVVRPALSGTTDQIEIERRTCVDAFGGWYDASRTPRCVLRSLVLAENHDERDQIVADLPSTFVENSPRTPITGVIVASRLRANELIAKEGLSTDPAAKITLRGDASTRIQAPSIGIYGSVFIDKDQDTDTAYVRGSEICRKNGQGCQTVPAPTPTPANPSPTPTPTPTPTLTPSLIAMTYDRPGSYVYTVPAGAAGRIEVQLIGAGGSGGCGDIRNGHGGGSGQLRTEVLSVVGPGTYQVVVGDSQMCQPRQNGGNHGIDGGESRFAHLVALGGEGGRRNVQSPGLDGGDDHTCYPNIEGAGAPGPLDPTGTRAPVCSCSSADYGGANGGYNTSGFKKGCAPRETGDRSTFFGAGGGGGGDDLQGGRGGHGRVRVIPLPN
jgi:hypothetical protein